MAAFPAPRGPWASPSCGSAAALPSWSSGSACACCNARPAMRVTDVGAGGRNGEAGRWRLTAPDGAPVEIDYTPALVTDDVELLTIAAAGGAGIAQVPFNACRQAIEQGRLQQLFPEYHAATHQLHA